MFTNPEFNNYDDNIAQEPQDFDRVLNREVPVWLVVGTRYPWHCTGIPVPPGHASTCRVAVTYVLQGVDCFMCRAYERVM